MVSVCHLESARSQRGLLDLPHLSRPPLTSVFPIGFLSSPAASDWPGATGSPGDSVHSEAKALPLVPCFHSNCTGGGLSGANEVYGSLFMINWALLSDSSSVENEGEPTPCLLRRFMAADV